MPTRPRVPLALAIAAVAAVVGCTPSHTISKPAPPPPRGTVARAVTHAGLDVVAENSHPGAVGWRITVPGPQHALEGFTDRTDVLAGQPIRLTVSTRSLSFTVTALRAGWYGGRLMREVWHSGAIRGRLLPAPRVTPTTYTVLTSWQPATTIPTADWPPGAYLLLLHDAAGDERYVPVTVRSPTTTGALVLVDAVTTWQAYNTWGGYSLYHGPGGEADFGHRSRVVTFDRPYLAPGDADFLGNELPAIALAERLGLPLAYATDVDLDREQHLLDGARGVVSLGHDEYWSTAMRDAVTAARDRGVNVAFLGANAVFRHIRFEPGPLTDGDARADRWEVNYKRRYGDPDNKTAPQQVTVDWREPPLGRPESSLTGTLYECNPVHADLVVADAASWLWAGIAARGSRVPGIIGSEYDRVNPAEPTPRGIEVLSHSPVVCRRKHSFSDSAYYTEPSGAGVFDAGTSLWVAALGAPGQPAVTTPAGQRLIDAVTSRLLTAMAAGPLARLHPAKGNLPAMHEYAGDPTVAAGND